MEAFRFDPTAPGLVLAPHLQYPTRDGADISLDRVSRHLSRHLPYVDVVGMETITRFENGDIARRHTYKNKIRSRSSGAIRTLVMRSHYLLERFLTLAFRREALTRLTDDRYGFVLFSYISTASLIAQARVQSRDRILAIWTHNDQIKWFRNVRRTFGSPLHKLVALLSEQWYHRFFVGYRDRFLFLYVTSDDFHGHTRHLGPHRGLVVPIGVDVDTDIPASGFEAAHNLIRLSFVGSLSARMNYDALVHFANHFFPAIKTRFADRLEVIVVGSNPTRDVKDLCAQQNWLLKPDVSDLELTHLYATTSYALLPFPYTTGAKLKLLGALAHGTPFLATAHVGVQLDEVPQHCVVSDVVGDWVEQIAALPHPDMLTRLSLQESARMHDWKGVVERMLNELNGHAAGDSSIAKPHRQ